ncbi:MAG: hypothetical protein K8S97_13570 [Anaerolineae bacterium]|nr:hypothetical protein [Anaerolineae bacterium]
MYRKVIAILLIILLVGGIMPVAAQDDAYTLYLTDDESFGFVYPTAWELSVDAEFGSVDFYYDAGVMFVYLPETAAMLTSGITDPVAFLTVIAGEFDATADDITEIGSGASLITIEEEEGETYVAQLIAMPLLDGSLGLIQGYVELAEFETYGEDVFLVALTMNVFEPGAAPSPDDLGAILAALGMEGDGGGDTLVLSTYGVDYQATITALRTMDLIPTGGSLLFTEDYAYFTGQGSFYTPLARNSPTTDFVMSAALSYEPSAATDLETCTLGMRVTWDGSTTTGYMDVGYTNAGTVYYLDIPPDADLAVEEIDPGVSVLVPHTFTIIVQGGSMTVFMDEVLIFEDVPVVERAGVWGVGLEGKGTGALCEARDIWVYQLDS